MGHAEYGVWDAPAGEAAWPEGIGAVGPCGEELPEPLLISMAKVAPEPLEWLWPGRIPLGAVSLLAGDPGEGKSLVALDLAARVSRGLPWPDAPDGPPAPKGMVVLVTADDDLGATVRPRLDAAGADPEAVVKLSAVRWPNTGHDQRFVLSRHLAALEKAIVRFPGVKLVVVDPVTAFLGRGGATHDVLVLLGAMANRTGVAVLLVGHLKRRGPGPAVHRAAGSLCLVAAARTVWAVVADPDDPERHLLLPVKSNLSARGDGLAYRIVPSAERADAARVAWESGPVALTAAEALGTGQELSERHSAARWVREVLAGGPVPAKEVARRAHEAELSWSWVKRAKRLAGVVTFRTGFQGRWLWRLAGQPAAATPGDAAGETPRPLGTIEPEGRETPNGHCAPLHPLSHIEPDGGETPTGGRRTGRGREEFKPNGTGGQEKIRVEIYPVVPLPPEDVARMEGRGYVEPGGGRVVEDGPYVQTVFFVKPREAVEAEKLAASRGEAQGTEEPAGPAPAASPDATPGLDRSAG